MANNVMFIVLIVTNVLQLCLLLFALYHLNKAQTALAHIAYMEQIAKDSTDG